MVKSRQRTNAGALELSLAFAFVDRNPRYGDEERNQAWRCVTADNAELYAWPIDVEQGHVPLCTGYLVSFLTGGYTISDPDLVLRPPLDLQMPRGASADPLVLTGAYETVLKSLRCPGANPTADGVRVACHLVREGLAQYGDRSLPRAAGISEDSF